MSFNFIIQKKKLTLEDWLKKRVMGAKSKYDYYDENLLPFNYDKTRYNKYYDDDDIDIKNTSIIMKRILENEEDNPTVVNLEYYVEQYENDNGLVNREVNIPPNTNHYHAGFLFKSLIEYNLNDDKSDIIIDKSMKKSFYKFCKDNS